MLNKSFGGVITRAGSADVSSLTSPTRKLRTNDHIELLSEKLRDYKAENQLLGRLLQDMKAEMDKSQNQVSKLKAQIAEGRQRAEKAEAQAREAQVDARRSAEEAAEVRTLRSRYDDHVAELERQLADARSALTTSQREVGVLQGRLDAAERAGRDGEAAKAQAEALRRESESRLGEYGDLKARLRESQARVEELEALKSAWREEWDRVKSAHRQQVQDLAAAVQSLQGRLKEATAAQEGGHRRAEDAEARVRALAGRVQELEGQLAVQRREHVAERAREADVHKDADRQRQSVYAATQRAEQLALANADLTREVQELTQRLRNAEEALGQARHVQQRLGTQLAEAQQRSIADVLAAAAAGANADAVSQLGVHGRPATLGQSPLDTYVRVLEHSLKEQTEQSTLQRAQLEEAHYLEAKTRTLLSESRQKEAEAHKRLQVELRRVHALERMRLQDIGEIQDVGRRAHALQQEVWALRDAAAAERARGGEAATPRGAPYPAVAMHEGKAVYGLPAPHSAYARSVAGSAMANGHGHHPALD